MWYISPTGGVHVKIPRLYYTEEFKQDAVRLTLNK